MKKLYDQNELVFSLVWIGLYVAGMNIALRVCGGLDDLAHKSVAQMLVPLVCVLLLAAAATLWILRHGLGEKYGLCRFQGHLPSYLWFLPLAVMSCVNLKNGLTCTAPFAVTLLMALHLAVAGYMEELIFRGFLFRAMAKDGLRSAIIVSSVTFGVGHIVNLANTSDVLGVLLQVCYAVAIGFLYTVIVHRGGSLWPCILSHMFVNGTSPFAAEHGPFTALVQVLFGHASPALVQSCSAALIILLSGSYAWWLWKKIP